VSRPHLLFPLHRPPPCSPPFPYTTLFRSYIGTARLGVLKTFNHHHRAACGNHKAIAVFIVGSRSKGWRVIILRTNRTHRIKHTRSEEHTSELQSRFDLVCRLLLEKKNTNK